MNSMGAFLSRSANHTQISTFPTRALALRHILVTLPSSSIFWWLCPAQASLSCFFGPFKIFSCPNVLYTSEFPFVRSFMHQLFPEHQLFISLYIHIHVYIITGTVLGFGDTVERRMLEGASWLVCARRSCYFIEGEQGSSHWAEARRKREPHRHLEGLSPGRVSSKGGALEQE